MGLLSGLGNLVSSGIDIITKPIDLICDWGREPLESRRHDRAERSSSLSHGREVELQESRIRVESEVRIKEKEAEAIKVRDIKKAIAEIEEWKKDKEFERMRLTTEAIINYQEQLTKLNVNAINAIGHMQLELRERAHRLIDEKTEQYKSLQSLAWNEAFEDLERIETTFADNERAKEILTNAVDKKLANIIDTANNFLLELNRDIRQLNEGISLLAEKGQTFIESHLDKFHFPAENMLENDAVEVKRITDKNV